MEIVDYIKQFPLREFKKGDMLLAEGQQTARLFALVKGFVKVTSIQESGNEQLLWIEGRYDVVPTEHLFSLSRTVSFYYTALTDGTYYDIDKASFIKFAKETPAFMSEVAVNMSEHYDDLMNRLNGIGQTSVRAKLVSTLRYVAERFSADETVDLYQLGLKLTHSDFAAMVGSTRETVSIELHTLMSEGYIEYDRTKFTIYLSKIKENAQ